MENSRSMIVKIGFLCVLILTTLGMSATGADSFESATPIPIAGSTITIKVWEEEGGQGVAVPFYAISSDGLTYSAPRATSYPVKLRYGTFDPLTEGQHLPIEENLRAGEDTNLYLVQFYTQPLEAYRQLIYGLGAEVYKFVANHTHIVKMSPETRGWVEDLPFVRWVGPFHPAYRLEEFMLRNIDQANQAYPTHRYNIMVFETGPRQKNAVAAKIEKLGGTVFRADAGKFLLEADLTPDQLFQVARWDEVQFIDRWGPMEKDMDVARQIGGADFLETTAGYTGQGVRGEVIDAGFNLNHVDFQSRPLILHTTVGSDSHGAATSGIVFGDGTGNAAARGMLPSGQGIVAAWSVVSIGQPRYDHTGELTMSPYFAVFQTASVGSPRTTQYSSISADTDAALFDFDIVHCQSQSNAGNQDSRPQAWAKNIISGGGIRHQNTLDRSDDSWTNGASIGPATDGRIKPDLSSFYDAILTTTTGSNTAYTTGFGGTSGATPIVCGHVGLFFQMWSEGIFGNDVSDGGTVFDNRSHMTTAKAMLINTAFRYDFTGQAHDLTRVHQGWGMPDLQELYEYRDNMFVVDEDEILSNLGTASYNISVLPGEPVLRVTMTYADPPGVPASAQHRINDLSLKVTSPSGTIFWGNNGLLDGNVSTQDGVANEVDTVENVFVDNPEDGAWTVEVIASEINEDSHVETPELDADFALVVTGGIQGPGFIIDPNPRSIQACAPTDAVFTIDVIQLLDFSDPVTLSATGEPAGTTLSFTSNPVTPGSMTDMVITNTGSAATGEYMIEVTGTAGDLVKTATVILQLSDQTPSAVALQSPVNGAVEVSRTPSLTWAASTQAVDYDLELATDPGFSNLILNETTIGTSFDVTTPLNNITMFYWRVRANNGCGNSGFSAAFSFTTIDQPDYWTELFTGDNDLNNITLGFIPNGVGDFYDGCAWESTMLPTDPTGGTVHVLSDDSSVPVAVSPSITFYGTDYDTIHIGSNGFVTFTGGDTDTTESLADHFSLPRVSGLFDDLNPAAGGQVSSKVEADRLAVTFMDVPEFNTSNTNTFQIEFFHNGEIHITLLNIDASDGLTGLSQGNGVPGDFIEADLSGLGPCEALCPADLNGDNTIDMTDVLLAGEQWGINGLIADIDGDGEVTIVDLALILEGFGSCPN